MPKQADNAGRIVLARPKADRVLHALGVGVVAAVILFLVWALISGISSGNTFNIIASLIWTVVLAPLLFILVTEYFRKIVLLENHISIEGWSGVPRVYAYDQIVDIETINVSENAFRWRGSHVKLTFDDGATVKISSGLASSRTFRKHLREKAGRTFRKKRKKS